MRAVNLLPLDARPGSRWLAAGREASARRVLSGAGIAAGVLALAFGGLFIHQRGVVDDRRSALHDVETRLVAAQARAAEVQAAQAASAARLTAFQTVVAQRLAWEDVLRDLSRVLPANVWLQSLNATSPSPTATAAGLRLRSRRRRRRPLRLQRRSASPSPAAPTRRCGSRRCSTGWRCSPGCRT